MNAGAYFVANGSDIFKYIVYEKHNIDIYNTHFSKYVKKYISEEQRKIYGFYSKSNTLLQIITRSHTKNFHRNDDRQERRDILCNALNQRSQNSNIKTSENTIRDMALNVYLYPSKKLSQGIIEQLEIEQHHDLYQNL